MSGQFQALVIEVLSFIPRLIVDYSVILSLDHFRHYHFHTWSYLSLYRYLNILPADMLDLAFLAVFARVMGL